MTIDIDSIREQAALDRITLLGQDAIYTFADLSLSPVSCKVHVHYRTREIPDNTDGYLIDHILTVAVLKSDLGNRAPARGDTIAISGLPTYKVDNAVPGKLSVNKIAYAYITPLYTSTSSTSSTTTTTNTASTTTTTTATLSTTSTSNSTTSSSSSSSSTLSTVSTSSSTTTSSSTLSTTSTSSSTTSTLSTTSSSTLSTTSSSTLSTTSYTSTSSSTTTSSSSSSTTSSSSSSTLSTTSTSSSSSSSSSTLSSTSSSSSTLSTLSTTTSSSSTTTSTTALTSTSSSTTTSSTLSTFSTTTLSTTTSSTLSSTSSSTSTTSTFTSSSSSSSSSSTASTLSTSTSSTLSSTTSSSSSSTSSTTASSTSSTSTLSTSSSSTSTLSTSSSSTSSTSTSSSSSSTTTTYWCDFNDYYDSEASLEYYDGLGNGGSYSAISLGKFVYTIPNGSNYVKGNLHYLYIPSGDFNVEVSVSNYSANQASTGVYAQLSVYDAGWSLGDTTDGVRVRVHQAAAGYSARFHCRYNDSTDSEIVISGLSALPGKIRIRRIGTTIYGDYFVTLGETWHNIGSKDYSTRANNIKEICLLGETNSTYGGTFAFDNLVFRDGCPEWCEYNDFFNDIDRWQRHQSVTHTFHVFTADEDGHLYLSTSSQNGQPGVDPYVYGIYQYAIPAGNSIVDFDLAEFGGGTYEEITSGPSSGYFIFRQFMDDTNYAEIKIYYYLIDSVEYVQYVSNIVDIGAVIGGDTMNILSTASQPSRFRIERVGETVSIYYYGLGLSGYQWVQFGSGDYIDSDYADDLNQIMVGVYGEVDDVSGDCTYYANADIDYMIFRDCCPNGTPLWTSTSSTTSTSSSSSTLSTTSTSSTTSSSSSSSSTASTLSTSSSTTSTYSTSSSTTTTYWCDYNNDMSALDDWQTATSNGSVTVESGKIRCDCDDSADGYAVATYKYRAPDADYSFTIDLANYTPDDNTDGVWTALRFTNSGWSFGGSTDAVRIFMEQDTADPLYNISCQFRVDSASDAQIDDAGVGTIPTMFRIRRSGTTLYADYYNGSWTNIGSKDFSTRASNLGTISILAYDNSLNGGYCDFDNLTFYYGCPTGLDTEF